MKSSNGGGITGQAGSERGGYDRIASTFNASAFEAFGEVNRHSEAEHAGHVNSLVENLSASALHRLCQPLTALQCTLELGMMRGETADLRAAMRDALGECVRTVAMLSSFRELLEEDAQYRGNLRWLDAGALAAVQDLESNPWAGDGFPLSQDSIGSMPFGEYDDHAFTGVAEAGVAEAGVAQAVKTQTCKTQTDKAQSERAQLQAAQVQANPAGIRKVFGLVKAAIAESGMEYCTSMISLSEDMALSEGSQMRFVWEFGSAPTERWMQEILSVQPFDLAEYDFCGRGLPHLAVAAIVTESMGGSFDCGTHGIAIGFRQRPSLQEAAGPATPAQVG